ncbi:hypothetical protein AB0L97_37700, partial [Nocardia sp. NPDC051911]
FRQLIDHESNIMQHSRFRHNVNESQPRKTRSKTVLETALNEGRRCAREPPSPSSLTKPRLAEVMIGRAPAAGVIAGWMTADSAYGRDDHGY